MADSVEGAVAPRIERLTIWAIALDLGVWGSVLGLGTLDSDAAYTATVVIFTFVLPLSTSTALGISVRSTLRAERLAAKIAAWVIVLASGALLLWWGWIVHELFFPTPGGG